MELPRTVLKHLALSHLPQRLLNPLKRRHYLRVVRDASEADEADLRIAEALVAEGELVVDVGANVGVYTRHLSEWVGPEGRVIAIEPVPVTFQFLSYNIRKLQLDNVELVNRAISNTSGTARMVVPSYTAGGLNYYQAALAGDAESHAPEGFEVERVALDRLLGDVPAPITFIKCDVEGHELECLQGAIDVIERWQPAWLIELSGDPDSQGTRAAHTLQLLEDRGYEILWYDGEGLRWRQPGDSSVNYLALTACHIERLRERGIAIR